MPAPRRCYGCYRPIEDCLCGSLPRIQNRTEVVILQHRRERTHPFNTARLVRGALSNACFLVDHKRELGERVVLRPGAALLYPGPSAELLNELPAARYPTQLVVVDGTWHQAKTLVRDLEVLRSLPRLRLAPVQPSQYQLRREPNAQALSTLEAVVAALRILEPETEGLDRLVLAFRSMIARQLAHPRSPTIPRFAVNRDRTWRNVPVAFRDELEHVVVAYGESAEGGKGIGKVPLPPIYWVAERLVSGERFACHIRPPSPLTESFLGHLALPSSSFNSALSLDDAAARWREFLRPDDLVTVYHGGAARLHDQLCGGQTPCLILKSIDYAPEAEHATLEELVDANRLSIGPIHHPGRAGQRLANAVAFVYFLRELTLRQR